MERLRQVGVYDYDDYEDPALDTSTSIIQTLTIQTLGMQMSLRTPPCLDNGLQEEIAHFKPSW